MFDLITGQVQHAPRHQAASVLLSFAVQVTTAAVLLATTLLVIDTPVPQAAMMMAFVAAPPPPPPPPPPPKAPEPERSVVPKPVPTTGAAAPVEPPATIEPEGPPADLDEGAVEVAGGVPGGIIGGVVGGLEPLMPPPPPPASRGPVRVGGVIKEPALIYRVDPVYPGVAISANIEGTVILEAIVDEEGRVDTVRVLRSVSVLDRAAVEAVKQWRYSPVILNGIPEKFILTVAVTFRLEGLKK
jgi:protein TonB